MSASDSRTGDLRLISTQRRIVAIRRRLVREAGVAVKMLEDGIAALQVLDSQAARAVRLSDDQVDNEEVAIEQECYEVLALRAPFAKDFRLLMFVLRVNADVERVADHASSIAKCAVRIADLAKGHLPAWPTSLIELSQRVPLLCHGTLKAVLDEDVEAARRIVASDSVIDQLEKRLFDETMEGMRSGPHGDKNLPIGMLTYRAGRELERVGDLMAAIAEDVVYLGTGEIIRHEKRRRNLPATGSPPASGGQ